MSERAIERLFPNLWRWAEPHLGADRRRHLFWILALVAFVYANFRAFDAERLAKEAAVSEGEQIAKAGSAQQQQSIDQLRSELDQAKRQIDSLSHPPRDPNQLYQSNAPVARIQEPHIDTTNGRLSFDAVTSSDQLDMTKPFMFRDWPLRCTGQIASIMTFGAMQQVTYAPLNCQIQPSQ